MYETSEARTMQIHESLDDDILTYFLLISTWAFLHQMHPLSEIDILESIIECQGKKRIGYCVVFRIFVGFCLFVWEIMVLNEEPSSNIVLLWQKWEKNWKGRVRFVFWLSQSLHIFLNNKSKITSANKKEFYPKSKF